MKRNVIATKLVMDTTPLSEESIPQKFVNTMVSVYEKIKKFTQFHTSNLSKTEAEIRYCEGKKKVSLLQLPKRQKSLVKKFLIFIKELVRQTKGNSAAFIWSFTYKNFCTTEQELLLSKISIN